MTVLIQDIKSRSVSWPVFPLLGICGFGLQFFFGYSLTEVLGSSFINILFLTVQFLLIWLYFFATRGKNMFILNAMIGWGDILFLMCAALFLPVITFVAFYVASLVLVLIGWLPYQRIAGPKERHVPLAGLQAFLLLLFFAGDWCCHRYHIYDDQWLISLIK